MAARAPAAYTKYVDTSRMVPRGEVRTTGPSGALDDQVFIRNKNELLVSDCFYPLYHVTVAPAWTEQRRYFFAFDRCDGAVTCSCQWAIRAWSEDLGGGPHDFSLAVYHVGLAARTSVLINANHVNQIWRAWQTQVMYCNGTENEIIVESQTTNANGRVHVAGIGLFTNT